MSLILSLLVAMVGTGIYYFINRRNKTVSPTQDVEYVTDIESTEDQIYFSELDLEIRKTGCFLADDKSGWHMYRYEKIPVANVITDASYLAGQKVEHFFPCIYSPTYSFNKENVEVFMQCLREQIAYIDKAIIQDRQERITKHLGLRGMK